MDKIALIALAEATWETIYIVALSSIFSLVFGFMLGLFVYLTQPNKPLAHKPTHILLSLYINITRSIPFIILMISALPLTRFLIGTTIGSNAAIIPLILAAAPFFARICENAFTEVPQELFDTAQCLGATTIQFIAKILIPESLPSVIRGATLTIIGLIGYSAMAGAIGGGGLGELAINYGYQRFNAWVTLETIIILVIIVQSVQVLGDQLAKKPKLKPIFMSSAAILIVCVSTQIYPLLFLSQPTLKVGILAGWSEEVMKTAEKVAQEKYNLKLKPIIFTDYVLPNSALEQGDIDANIFQHLPYLQAQNKAQHYHLVSLTKTFVYPMGFYSKKYASIDALPVNALIALPNDPSNQARALLLLQKNGQIQLDKRRNILSSIQDISENPKHFRFKLMDAAQLPRVLKDADLVAITNDFLTPAGLSIQQALIKEGKDSLYANIIAIRQNEQTRTELQHLASVMHSEEVQKATYKLFPHHAALPAW